MTPDQAASAIYAEFLAQWGTSTRVVLDGQGDQTEPGPGVEWVRVSFRDYAGGQHTLGPIGSRKYRRLGAAWVQTFVPVERGRGRGTTLAHAARAILEGRTLGLELSTYDGVVTQVPLPRGEKSYQTNVEVRVAYDETK